MSKALTFKKKQNQLNFNKTTPKDTHTKPPHIKIATKLNNNKVKQF